MRVAATRKKASVKPFNPDRPSATALWTEGEFMFEHAVSIGLEGVVGKRADSPHIGGRSRDCLKAKPVGYHDGWERPGRRTIAPADPQRARTLRLN
ncbi:MAG: hypothetical protein ACREV5_16945 [Steroidobacter sp.]